MTTTTTKPPKVWPGVKVCAGSAGKVLAPRLIGAGLTLGLWTALAWVVTVALRHTAGVGIPWFGLGVLGYLGQAVLRLVAEHVGSGWAKGVADGKHQAELAHATAAMQAMNKMDPSVLAGLFGKSGAPKGADTGASFGNYL